MVSKTHETKIKAIGILLTGLVILSACGQVSEQVQIPKPKPPTTVEIATGLYDFNPEKGFETSLSYFCGEDQEGTLWFDATKNTWGPDGFGGTDSGSLAYGIRKDFTAIKTAKIEQDDLDKLIQWEKSSGLERPFTVDKGVLSTDGLKLFTVPGWVDGKGDSETRINVTRYGNETEYLYSTRFITLPKGVVPPHDYSSTKLFLVSGGKATEILGGSIHVSQAERQANGNWFVLGGRLNYNRCCLVITPEGTAIDLQQLAVEKLNLPELQMVTVIGMVPGKVVLSIGSEESNSGLTENICKETFYEIDENLNLKKRPESISEFRKNCPGAPSNNLSGQWILGMDGTLYRIASGGASLLDLTHFRSMDIYPDTDTLGTYKSIGMKHVKLLKSDHEVSLPAYLYKGTVCFCAEDFEGLGYTKQWVPHQRELKLISGGPFKEKKLIQLEDGPILKSDILVSFDGWLVDSYCIGDCSLVPYSSIPDCELVDELLQ